MDKKRILLLSLLVAALFSIGLYLYNYIPDDTFITLRYARNVSRGEGFVYNTGEPIEGYTNFLWLILLVTAHALGLPFVMTARIMSLVFTVTLLLLSGLAVKEPARRAGYGRWNGAICLFLPPLLLAAAPPVSVWALSGSEIPLFSSLLLLGFILLRRGSAPAAVFAILGLLGLVRPEGLLFYAAAGAALLVRRPEERRRIVAAGASVFAILYGPYLIWKWWYFGSLIPNTFYAKTGPVGILIDNGFRYVSGFVASYGYLLPLGLLLSRKRLRQWEVALPAAIILLHWLSIMLLGGDWMPYYRLLLPTLPLAAIVATEGLITAALERSSAPEHESKGNPVPIVVVMLVVLMMFAGGIRYERFEVERLAVKAFSHVGRRFHNTLPPSTSVGLGSIGAIGYYSDMRIVDILGLTDAHIARHGKIVAREPSHMKTDGARVLSLEPDLLLLGNIQIHRGERGPEMMRHKVQEEDIVDQPAFQRDYTFVNIPIGNGFYLSCYKRKSYSLPLSGQGW